MLRLLERAVGLQPEILFGLMRVALVIAISVSRSGEAM